MKGTRMMKAQEVHPDAATPGEPEKAADSRSLPAQALTFVGGAKPGEELPLLDAVHGDGGDDDDLDMGGNAALLQERRLSMTATHVTEMDETRKQLEDLQIRTIFSLVEDIELDLGGQTAQKKLLFLTNKQARKFDFSNITKVLQAMDVSPMPQLVINLFCSGVNSQTDRPGGLNSGHWMDKRSHVLPMHWHGEASAADVHSTDLRLMHFLKTCVLPVAIQTNALVLVHADNCSLAHAFSELCSAEVQKMGGGRLPFTVLCIFQAVALSCASDREGTVAHGLKAKSKRWKEREDACRAAYSASRGDEGIDLPFLDLPQGATHFIIVDAVTNGSWDTSARNFFKNSLVQRVSENLPSIAVQTYDYGGMGVVPVLQDYAGRGLPLLLLDSRPRPAGNGAESMSPAKARWALVKNDIHAVEDSQIREDLASLGTCPSSISEAAREIEACEQKLQAAGTTNTYLMSMVAYLRRVVDKAGDSTSLAAGGASQQSRTVPLHERLAEEQERELRQHQAEARANGAGTGNGTAVQIVSKHTLATEAICIMQKQVQQSASHTSRQLQGQLESLLAELDGAEAWSVGQLRSLVQRASRSLRESWDFAKGKDASLVRAHPQYFCLKRGIKDGKLWVRVLCVHGSVSEANVDDARDAYHAFVTAWRDEATASVSKPTQLSRQVYTGLLDLLQLDCVYSNNLDDTQRIKQTIASVAKIDRLPSENSVEALVILQSAWDRVDMYSRIATQCKKATKALYGCLLLIGFTVSTITVVSLNERLNINARPGHVALIDAGTLSQAVIGLSLFGSLVGSVVSFMNPGLRWQQLRGAALSLECEIWRFRTRTGHYSISAKVGFERYSKEAERKLLMHLETINEHVSKSASVMETTYFSSVDLFGKTRKGSQYSHGQYQASRMCGTYGMSHQGDDHYSPLKPQDYMRFRIEPTSGFYQGKLPKYYRSRVVSEMLLLLSMFSGTILAFMKLSEWAALATSFSAAMAAWKAFTETDKKLGRYSNTVEELASTVLWWRQLSEVEQASLGKVNILISTCEGIFEREHDAWLSTSVVSRLDQAAEGGDSSAGQATGGGQQGGGGNDNEGADRDAKAWEKAVSYV
jgi:hypothetical protein